MAKIDPNARKAERKAEGWSEIPEEGAGGAPRVSSPVKGPALVCGFDRVKSAQKGTKGIEIRFVLTEGAQAGHVVDRTFWQSSAFEGQLADLALSFGYESPFDPDDDDDLEKVFSSNQGVVGVDVRAKDAWTDSEGKERISHEARFFYRYKDLPEKGSDRRAKWKEHKAAGVASWDGYLKWKESRPAKPAGGGGGSRGGGQQADDDIPF